MNNKHDINKWYIKEANRVFKERLYYILGYYEEKIPTPILKIRKMKTRWGVCNNKIKSIST
jgi:predicted metal-dependent hydrolase